MRSIRNSVSLLLLVACGKSEPPAAPPGSEAQELLAKAGFPGGKGFPSLTLIYNRADTHQRIAAAIQEMWREQLGVRVELLKADWNVFMTHVDRGDFEIARRAWIGEYHDPHAFLDLFRRDSGTNPTGWS